VDRDVKDELTKLITSALEVDDLDDEQIAKRIMETFIVLRKVPNREELSRHGAFADQIRECIGAGFSMDETAQYLYALGRANPYKSISSYYYVLRKEMQGSEWEDNRKYNKGVRGPRKGSVRIRREEPWKAVYPGRELVSGEQTAIVWRLVKEGKSIGEVMKYFTDEEIGFTEGSLRNNYHYHRKKYAAMPDWVPPFDRPKKEVTEKDPNVVNMSERCREAIRAGISRVDVEAQLLDEGVKFSHKSLMEMYSKAKGDLKKQEGK